VSSDESKPKKRAVKNPTAPAEQIQFVMVGGEKAPKGPARYRDPANPFNTWSGRGKRPHWLRDYLDQGRLLTDFEVRDPED
jgi:DNA-binding protein H-NS